MSSSKTNFNKMTWGVKASFRGYVEAMEGKIEATNGAVRNDEGCFEFNAIPGGDLSIAEDGSASGSVRFEGTVTFDAHGGMLKSELTELGIDASDEGLLLTALETPMNQGRCAIAKLVSVESSSDDAITLGSEITMDGMYVIADNYPPGTPLDPVELS